ncbi:MAG: acyltransferase [Phycisphaerales bacterium]|nr:acyltransferase [Phycisphaerales bacterium]
MSQAPGASTPATKTSLRVNNFDLIRLLAASQVVIMHMVLYLQLQPTSAVGKFLLVVFLNFPGVPIFFVISGFLISLSWERSGSPGIYATNRFLRLFPALWVCLIVTIIVLLASGYLTSGVFSTQEFLRWIFWQATIYQTYTVDMLRGFPTHGAPNGSLWSIPVEMQFYVVLPIIYLLLPKSKKAFTWGLIGITIVLAAVSEWIIKTQDPTSKQGFFLLMISCLPYVYMFLFGVIIQKTLPILMPILRGMFIPWVAFYLAVVLILHYGFDWFTGIRLGTNNPPILISAIMAMTTISGAYTFPRLSGWLLRSQDISYGTYIYHMVFINLVLYLEIANVAWQIIIVVVATYGCAILSWKFIEQPTLALKKRTLRTSATAKLTK